MSYSIQLPRSCIKFFTSKFIEWPSNSTRDPCLPKSCIFVRALVKMPTFCNSANANKTKKPKSRQKYQALWWTNGVSQSNGLAVILVLPLLANSSGVITCRWLLFRTIFNQIICCLAQMEWYLLPNGCGLWGEKGQEWAIFSTLGTKQRTPK